MHSSSQAAYGLGNTHSKTATRIGNDHGEKFRAALVQRQQVVWVTVHEPILSCPCPSPSQGLCSSVGRVPMLCQLSKAGFKASGTKQSLPLPALQHQVCWWPQVTQRLRVAVVYNVLYT